MPLHLRIAQTSGFADFLNLPDCPFVEQRLYADKEVVKDKAQELVGEVKDEAKKLAQPATKPSPTE